MQNALGSPLTFHLVIRSQVHRPSPMWAPAITRALMAAVQRPGSPHQMDVGCRLIIIPIQRHPGNILAQAGRNRAQDFLTAILSCRTKLILQV